MCVRASFRARSAYATASKPALERGRREAIREIIAGPAHDRHQPGGEHSGAPATRARRTRTLGRFACRVPPAGRQFSLRPSRAGAAAADRGNSAAASDLQLPPSARAAAAADRGNSAAAALQLPPSALLPPRPTGGNSAAPGSSFRRRRCMPPRPTGGNSAAAGISFRRQRCCRARQTPPAFTARRPVQPRPSAPTFTPPRPAQAPAAVAPRPRVTSGPAPRPAVTSGQAPRLGGHSRRQALTKKDTGGICRPHRYAGTGQAGRQITYCRSGG